jgi:hypothetical protein
MTPTQYAFIGLTALVAALVAVVTFAALRFVDAAHTTRQRSRSDGGEMMLMSAALQDAVTKLKAQERATAARAEASERKRSSPASPPACSSPASTDTSRVSIRRVAGCSACRRRRHSTKPSSPLRTCCSPISFASA